MAEETVLRQLFQAGFIGKYHVMLPAPTHVHGRRSGRVQAPFAEKPHNLSDPGTGIFEFGENFAPDKRRDVALSRA
jgi:hypothetical protein